MQIGFGDETLRTLGDRSTVWPVKRGSVEEKSMNVILGDEVPLDRMEHSGWKSVDGGEFWWKNMVELERSDGQWKLSM